MNTLTFTIYWMSLIRTSTFSALIKILLALSSILVFVFTSSHGQAQTVQNVARQMFESIEKVSTLAYEMKKMERINDKMRKQRAFIKLHRKPFRVYIRQIAPNKGVEVLYRHGEETALVNPAGFPWFNIRLEPLGSRMIKDQHHTIFDSGFDYFGSILKLLFRKYQSELNEMATITGKNMGDNNDCWVLTFNNPNFRYIDYTVQKDETVFTIARKLKVNAYMIMEQNTEVDHYYDVSPGQVIQVPNDYSPNMTLYIHKKTHLPAMIQVYDDKGLYQQYEFEAVKLNPSFHPDEFSPDFHEYDF